MGTDIHMLGEYKHWMTNVWTPFTLPEELQGRNYAFFAHLADVRNGFGFAGVYRHEPVKPLTSDRGFPEDMSEFARAWATEQDMGLAEKLLPYGPGDHSAGYATLRELEGHDWEQGADATTIATQLITFLMYWQPPDHLIGYDNPKDYVRILFSFDS